MRFATEKGRAFPTIYTKHLNVIAYSENMAGLEAATVDTDDHVTFEEAMRSDLPIPLTRVKLRAKVAMASSGIFGGAARKAVACTIVSLLAMAASEPRTGRWLFDQPWEPGVRGEQLASSCAGCHFGGGGGPSPQLAGARAFVFFAYPKAGRRTLLGNSMGKGLETSAVAIDYVAEAFVYPDGTRVVLNRPRYRWPGALGTMIVSPRIAPSLEGDGNCIAAAGPCGYRFEAKDLSTQIANAFLNEMAVKVVVGRRSGFDEIDGQDIEALAGHLRTTMVRQVTIDPWLKASVTQLGCTGCHAADSGAAGRLADMGTDLADPGGEAMPFHRSWASPTLSQILSAKSGAVYLHDGRARTVEQAILWHGGDASDARDRFVSLSSDRRQAILSKMQR